MPTKSQIVIASVVFVVVVLIVMSMANVGGIAAVALEGSFTTQDVDGTLRSRIPLALGSRLGGPINLALAIFALAMFCRTKQFREIAAMIPGQFGIGIQKFGTTEIQESRDFYMELLERSIDKNNRVMIDAAILEIQSLNPDQVSMAAPTEAVAATSRAKK